MHPLLKSYAMSFIGVTIGAKLAFTAQRRIDRKKHVAEVSAILTAARIVQERIWAGHYTGGTTEDVVNDLKFEMIVAHV